MLKISSNVSKLYSVTTDIKIWDLAFTLEQQWAINFFKGLHERLVQTNVLKFHHLNLDYSRQRASAAQGQHFSHPPMVISWVKEAWWLRRAIPNSAPCSMLIYILFYDKNLPGLVDCKVFSIFWFFTGLWTCDWVWTFGIGSSMFISLLFNCCFSNDTCMSKIFIHSTVRHKLGFTDFFLN